MNILNPLSNLQMELLELYSTHLSNEELNDFKIFLAQFFAKKAIQEADKVWEEKNFSHQDMEKWLIG